MSNLLSLSHRSQSKMAAPTKQYGLILPQKKGLSKTLGLPKPSVFGDDSDEETSVGESLQKEAIKKKMMKQTRLEMQKALEQDSTVYDYDGVYDDIQKQRLENHKKILGGADKKPKYIHQLMKAVDERKKEQERREERKIQKEREAEGEKFADKDAYVTSAYKKKLLEREEELEREKREAEIEAALDVKKQKDLSGFYRHLLNQTVGEEAIPDRSAERSETSNVSKDTERTSPGPSAMSHENIPSSGSDNEEEPREQKPGFSKPSAGSGHLKRQYRQRSPSSGSGEDREKEREKDKHKKSHRDHDRDRDRHRGREKDNRRSDKDRKKDRERDRGRDYEHSKGRGETDRHSRRERSPKERERDRNGEREKRRHSDEDKRKEKKQEEEKERRKDLEREKMSKTEDVSEKEKVEELKVEGEQKETEEEKTSKFAKRSTDQTVTSARERYMARQIARSTSKSYIEKEED
ncbi:nuclear speckle splicing regulatory protein 1 isoform X1 [Oryzias melastigma]|uniref:nuclear speckle splicing regulatory protein 1 isoform X1 n=2 Tax=Oryzias melastigma TaxID=30732 RepID=UPI000CF7F3B5|nr:nuclear speckle splicing regulatory protein 1 isoform X1 [Oryzias melastigma]